MIARTKGPVRAQASYGNITVLSLLKLFLGIVPRSSAEITRALCGCFRGGFVYMYVVSFRLISKQRKTSNTVGVSSLIF